MISAQSHHRNQSDQSPCCFPRSQMLCKIVKRSLNPTVGPRHRNLKLQDRLVSGIGEISDERFGKTAGSLDPRIDRRRLEPYSPLEM